MKRRAEFHVRAALLALCLASGAAAAAGMTIQSPAFDNGQPIPQRYSCDGAGVSPPLKIAGVPGKAASLVLIVDDPDAPSGTWVHWVRYNMAPDVATLAPGTSGRFCSLLTTQQCQSVEVLCWTSGMNAGTKGHARMALT